MLLRKNKKRSKTSSRANLGNEPNRKLFEMYQENIKGAPGEEGIQDPTPNAADPDHHYDSNPYLTNNNETRLPSVMKHAPSMGVMQKKNWSTSRSRLFD